MTLLPLIRGWMQHESLCPSRGTTGRDYHTPARFGACKSRPVRQFGMTEVRKPFWARCGECNHCWAAAYAPMQLSKIAKILRACICPRCASKKIFVAKQNDGELLESGSA